MYFFRRFGWVISVLIVAAFLSITTSFSMDDFPSDTSEKQSLGNSSLMKSLSDFFLGGGGVSETPSPKQQNIGEKHLSIEGDSSIEYENGVFIDGEGSSPRNVSKETYTSFPSADRIFVVDPKSLSEALLDQQYINDDNISRSSSGSERSFSTVLSQERSSWINSLGKFNAKGKSEEDNSDCCCCFWPF